MTAADEAIGISVSSNGDHMFLRILLRDAHLQRLNNPERLMIRGQAANGFIITPDNDGNKISRGSLTNGAYLQETLSNFDLKRVARRRVNIIPQFENGHIRVPPLPSAWVEATGEFSETYEEKTRDMKLGHEIADDALRMSSTTGPVNGHAISPTVPPPKPTQTFVVPADATMNQMQAQLADHLDKARAILRRMEEQTGMRFVLDRNLRVVVALPVA